MPPAAPDVSVVIPTRNEEENALSIAEAVIREMEATGLSFDVIFIDNASQDRTVELLRDLCARDLRIRLIVNTRDFGQMRSPTHAIFQASGRAIINMCADFQDPPALIGEFVRCWRAGADIVLGVRASEKNSMALSAARGTAYWFFEKFGDYPVIRNATGFGLYTRRVVREIERLKEPEPFFRGMLVETGFRIETIAYPRPPRAGGLSNNNFFALLDFTLSGISGSSKRLVRVPFYLGVLGAVMAVVMLLGGLAAFVLGKPIAGWLIASVVQTEIALLFVFLGLVGDQIRLISERSRQTPLVIEHERINFPNDG